MGKIPQIKIFFFFIFALCNPGSFWYFPQPKKYMFSTLVKCPIKLITHENLTHPNAISPLPQIWALFTCKIPAFFEKIRSICMQGECSKRV